MMMEAMNFIRRYAAIFIIALVSLFVVAIVVDEYGDYQRGQQDMLVEACEEIDEVDIEWNEGDDVEDWHFVCNETSPMIRYEIKSSLAVESDIHRSIEQWRGLVRKYYPGRIININKQASGMNPMRICTVFFFDNQNTIIWK